MSYIIKELEVILPSYRITDIDSMKMEHITFFFLGFLLLKFIIFFHVFSFSLLNEQFLGSTLDVHGILTILRYDLLGWWVDSF